MSVRLCSSISRPHLRLSALEALAQRILAAAGSPRGELSVNLIGDRRMRRLNLDYRGQDRTTDVLAFAFREVPGPASPLLGDVAISVPAAVRQARDAGHSLEDELATLLVHGILHLLGFDHERSPAEARRMHRRERAVLRALRPLPSLVVSGARRAR